MLLLSVALGLEELDPLSAAEQSDEISQVREQAVWIACMMIAYNKLELSSSMIDKVMRESNHHKYNVRKKLAADILERCCNQISWTEAEKFLASEHLEYEGEELKEIVAIDLQQFQGEIIYTQAQTELLEKIEKVMNKAEEEYPDPPVLQSYDIVDEEDPDYTHLFAGVIGVGLFIIHRKNTYKPKVVDRPSSKKKKN